MDINAFVHTQAAAHPVYAFLLGVIVGPLWPKALAWLLTNGVDLVVSKILPLQKAWLKRFGATDAQISAAEKDEAAALARAADDVKKDAGAP